MIWIVISVYLPSFLPAERYAQLLLRYSGSIGSLFPTFPNQSHNYTPIHRYYDPLRLPIAHFASFACRYLNNTLHTRPLFVFCLCSSYRRIRVYTTAAGSFTTWTVPLNLIVHKETIGSPKFPSYPYECMPRSKTPEVS